jgi:hypothetical protein
MATIAMAGAMVIAAGATTGITIATSSATITKTTVTAAADRSATGPPLAAAPDVRRASGG